MLVLGRRVGEGIEIGPDVRVVVTRVEGKKVHLGIEAPRDCVIVRDELLSARQDGRARAEGTAS